MIVAISEKDLSICESITTVKDNCIEWVKNSISPESLLLQ
jgi:hypothetical protein